MGTRETSNDYHGVIAPLDNANRLVLCDKGIQWILQRRKGNRWKGMSFFRTREALLNHLHQTIPNLSKEAEGIVAMLPAVLT